MHRRRWIAGTVGVAGAAYVAARSWEPPRQRRALAGRTDRRPVDGFRVDLAAGETADLSDGVAVGFVAVTADDRCPADLDCDAPGSADAVIALTRADDRGNRRTQERTLTFQPRRPLLAYDDDQIIVVASLSGDSGHHRAQLTLTLVVLGSVDTGSGAS